MLFLSYFTNEETDSKEFNNFGFNNLLKILWVEAADSEFGPALKSEVKSAHSVASGPWHQRLLLVWEVASL